MLKIKPLLLLLFLQSFSLFAQAQLTNGIYAVFDTTLGSFTSQIHYVEAPLAAANFIGLAEGSLPWIDGPSGRLTQGPYYDGNTFHRVIDGFVIQGGSPNGQGTDGPGYAFIDVFNPALTHDSAGVMSMANSGPHSNGSQFFITLNPTPDLDPKHVVFGRVIDGLTVVQDLGDVTTDCIVLGTNACDSNISCFICPTCTRCYNRPVTNMVMNSVQILRIGSAAQAFDPATNNLPLCSSIPTTATIVNSNLTLNIPVAIDRELFLSQSTNITDWSIALRDFSNFNGTRTLGVSLTSEIEYFTSSNVEYPHILPSNVNQHTLTMNLSGSSFTNTPCQIIRNTALNSFTYNSGFTNHPAGDLAFVSPLYDPERPYFADFQPVLLSPSSGPHIFLDLELFFSSSTNGVIQGKYFPDVTANPSETVSGTFSVESL